MLDKDSVKVCVCVITLLFRKIIFTIIENYTINILQIYIDLFLTTDTKFVWFDKKMN